MKKTSPPKEAVIEALKYPNGWVYEIEDGYGDNDGVPPDAIKGAWKVNEKGIIEGNYIPNSKYNQQKKAQSFGSTMTDKKKISNRQYACQMARKYLGGDISKYFLLDNFPDTGEDEELNKLYKALTNEPKVRWLFGTTKEKYKEYVLKLYELINEIENKT